MTTSLQTFDFAPLPTELHWENPPTAWQLNDARQLQITANRQTDLFTDPAGAVMKNDSPRALCAAAGNFIFSARVDVDFHAMFDAGVLILYANADYWAKLCFEFSPQGQPMVVSVINRGVSDDCNSVVVNGNSVYLRIARLNSCFAFHYSTDGKFWHLVRYFTLGALDALGVGFSAQSPTGEGCAALFAEVRYDAETLANLRNGE